MTLQCKLQATHPGNYVLIDKLERRSFFNVVKSQLENEFANRITVPSHTGMCPGGGAQRPLGPKKNLETTLDPKIFKLQETSYVPLMNKEKWLNNDPSVQPI